VLSPVLTIDGAAFSDLDGFYEEVSRRLIPGADWGRNLDAFNDILRGGFGTPEGGLTLRWRNASLSRERLGYAETLRYLRRKLQRCHPSNIPSVEDGRRVREPRRRSDTLRDIGLWSTVMHTNQRRRSYR
jgi:RNAse (barnase) inhibitor barstar